MLTKANIKDIERTLNNEGSIFYHGLSDNAKEKAGAYCRGMAYVLDMLGYDIKWDNEKATLIECD